MPKLFEVTLDGTFEPLRDALPLRSTAGKSADAARPVLPRACSTRAAAAARSRLLRCALTSSSVSSVLWKPVHQSADGQAVALLVIGAVKAGGISAGFSA